MFKLVIWEVVFNLLLLVNWSFSTLSLDLFLVLGLELDINLLLVLLQFAGLDILIVLKIVEILKWIGLHELILVSDVVWSLIWIGSDVFNVLVDVALYPVDIILVKKSFVVIYPADSVVLVGPLLLLLVHLWFFDVLLLELSILTSNSG